jgi:hypothetical protein
MKLWQLHYLAPEDQTPQVHWAPTEHAAREERKRLRDEFKVRPSECTIQHVEVPTTEGREALCAWLNERNVESWQ